MDKNLMSQKLHHLKLFFVGHWQRNKLSQSQLVPNSGFEFLGSSLSMPDKSSTPTVDLLETLAQRDSKIR